MIFGKRLYLAVNFNLNDPVGSVRTGADTATEWYKDKMNNQAATDTEKDYYDNPNPFADFEMSGTVLDLTIMYCPVICLVTRPMGSAAFEINFQIMCVFEYIVLYSAASRIVALR